MRNILLFAALMMVSLLAPAIEISDIHPGLTRSSADDELSKDYQYTVLTDATVRRSWKTKHRNISIDFKPSNDKWLMVDIKYPKAATKSQAMKDARRIANTKSNSWTKTTTKGTSKIGLKRGQMLKLENGIYLFMEMQSDNKVNSLVMFSSKPTENRRELREGSSSTGVTAMGSTSSGSAIPILNRDEATRKATAARKPAIAANDGKDSVVKPETKPALAANEPEFDTSTDTGDDYADDGFMAMVDDYLRDMGVEEPGVLHYAMIICVLLGVILLLPAIFGRKAKKLPEVAPAFSPQPKVKSKVKPSAKPSSEE